MCSVCMGIKQHTASQHRGHYQQSINRPLQVPQLLEFCCKGQFQPRVATEASFSIETVYYITNFM